MGDMGIALVLVLLDTLDSGMVQVIYDMDWLLIGMGIIQLGHHQHWTQVLIFPFSYQK